MKLLKTSIGILAAVIIGVSIGCAIGHYPITTRVHISDKKDDISTTPKDSESISLLFIGDIMLDRTIRTDGQKYGYKQLFSCLESDMAGHDAVIGNLEGTITSFASVSQYAEYLSPESFRFTFEKPGVQALMDIGLSHVSLANNHIQDFGEEGIVQTIATAKEMGLKTFGDPRVGEEIFYIETFKNTRVAFIGYNEFFGNSEETFSALEAVQKESDMQIIFAHWGTEYAPAREDVKMLAREFVRAGADLVIGAHPHVVQESEIFENVPIYYSLGNFIFDQYWEESVRKGLMLNVIIQNGKVIDSTEIPIEGKRHAGTCVV